MIRAKILLQTLWKEGTDWDECAKPNSVHVWCRFVENLSEVGKIEVPRWIGFSPTYNIQTHGFCDASQEAYCACLYIRCQQDINPATTRLLVAKGKVAPLQTISLPRLELCGAVLLSKLLNQVRSQLDLQKASVYLWCDSSIVLAWLEKPPYVWKTYVANRISEILKNVGNSTWRHVRSNDNPADLGTRGCKPQELVSHSLWWHGPEWLCTPPNSWPSSQPQKTQPPDQRTIKAFHMIEKKDVIDGFSSFARVLRIIGYVFRFFHKCKKISQDAGPLTQHEINNTKTRLIILAQKRYFEDEYS
ncbi:uncharacterized protein LOC118739813 [Rhagoletis pomonella]|uniref:uncharacterized protein LOC118739813 n=1 Tax=Rhagoletis pomonella TaxID=28610 RepID=UPI0017868ED4|nr:uncharacterized protein LOC118739813 [Rhagoletis pomonella]